MAFNLSFIALLILLTIAVWWWSRRLTEKAGLPAGNVIYTDEGAWFPNNTPLIARDLRLVGKPDYLVEENDGSIIPVEIKSKDAPQEPHEGHVLQLAAYCLLVERHFGVRPAYGILQYRDLAFAVDYTEDMEEDLLSLLAEMREVMFAVDADRDHNDWRRCARCGLQEACYQRLA